MTRWMLTDLSDNRFAEGTEDRLLYAQLKFLRRAGLDQFWVWIYDSEGMPGRFHPHEVIK